MRRVIPKIQPYTLRSWFISLNLFSKQSVNQRIGKLYFFIDEFADYYDVPIGINTAFLLHFFGYHVEIIPHNESGRAYISKGFLRKAQIIADHNFQIVSPLRKVNLYFDKMTFHSEVNNKFCTFAKKNI